MGDVSVGMQHGNLQLDQALPSSTRPTTAPAPRERDIGRTLSLRQHAAHQQVRLAQSRSSVFKRRSHLTDDARRDSGMAASTSTTDDALERSESGSMSSSARQESYVPSIILNDKPRALSPKFLRRPKTRQEHSSSNELSDDSAPQIRSFSGIATNIPSGEFDDPFSSPAMAVSNRGSLHWSSPKIPTADPKRHSRAKSSINSVLDISPNPHIDSAGLNYKPPSLAREEHPPQDPTPVTRPLSAAAAQEHKDSIRVRSWYQPDVPFSREVSLPRAPRAETVDPPLSEEADVVTDLPETRSPRLDAPEAGVRETRSASTLSNRTSRYETAGGFEDWTDLDSADVDRYGYYDAKVVSSKRSSVLSNSQASPPQHPGRLSTTATESRRPQSQQLSVAPTRDRRRYQPFSSTNRHLHTSPSIHTARTNRSVSARAARPFSRTSRLFEQAPSMLSPSPGLEDGSSHNPSRRTLQPHDRTLELRRGVKWERMAIVIPSATSAKGGGTDYTFNIRDSKLIARTWKGIPDRWRGAAWHAFLTASASRHPHAPTEKYLENFFHDAQIRDCKDDLQIDMDVPRTINSHVQFRQRYRGGQRSLFRVLHALSVYFPELGYVQGMACIASTLLQYYHEERAFVVAVRMWSLRGIGWLYSEGFGGLMSALEELETACIKDATGPNGRRLREVQAQLERLGIHASAWGPKWYLTLFNYVLPFKAQLRVWDVFMLLGDTVAIGKTATESDASQMTTCVFERPNLDVLHAVAAAVLHALSDTIVGAEFENAMGVLTAPVPATDEDMLMKVARQCWREREKRR